MRAEDLVGVWIIKPFHIENMRTRQRSQPWGKSPGGTLVFHPGGRLFAIITPDGRSPPQSEPEQADAFRNMLAYSGPFRVDPPNKLVTSVDIAWHEPWVGTEQTRYCEFNADSLTLTSAPLAMPQRPGEQNEILAVVEWRRELMCRP